MFGIIYWRNDFRELSTPHRGLQIQIPDFTHPLGTSRDPPPKSHQKSLKFMHLLVL